MSIAYPSREDHETSLIVRADSHILAAEAETLKAIHARAGVEVDDLPYHLLAPHKIAGDLHRYAERLGISDYQLTWAVDDLSGCFEAYCEFARIADLVGFRLAVAG